LFDIRPATRWCNGRDGNLGQKKWTGENPPQGALITYYLKSQPESEVNITISDNAGRLVRRLRRVADDAGINRSCGICAPTTPPGVAAGGRGGRAGGAGAGGVAADADTFTGRRRARSRGGGVRRG